MTKKQRAQVVELLRCAADLNGIGNAAYAMGIEHGQVHDLAIDATRCVRVRIGHGEYAIGCLEAAARVEERSWPLSGKAV